VNLPSDLPPPLNLAGSREGADVVLVTIASVVVWAVGLPE
jgi:hypothetical protein